MKTLQAYQFRITKDSKQAWAEVAPELILKAIKPELEAFAQSITPKGMADHEIKVDHIGIITVRVGE